MARILGIASLILVMAAGSYLLVSSQIRANRLAQAPQLGAQLAADATAPEQAAANEAKGSKEEAAPARNPVHLPALTSLDTPVERGVHQAVRFEEVRSIDLPPVIDDTPAPDIAAAPADGRTKLLPEEIDTHTKVAKRMDMRWAALNRASQGGQPTALTLPMPDGSTTRVSMRQVR
jgi:hypothetical protein